MGRTSLCSVCSSVDTCTVLPSPPCRTFLCEDDSGGAGDGGALSCGIQKIVGLACDVQQPDEVRALAEVAHKELGDINIWVSRNAATPQCSSSAENSEQSTAHRTALKGPGFGVVL